MLLPLIFISCSGKKENMNPYPESQLGERLDTISIPALQKWVSEHPEDIDALSILCNKYALGGDYSSLVQNIKPIFNKALDNGEDMTAVFAGTYMGQAYSMMFMPDSMDRYFDLIYDKARKLELNFPLMVINNQSGVSNLIYAMNYSEALYFFYEALKYCPEKDSRNRLLILWNIINTYYLREDKESMQKDSEGIGYANEIYEYGVSHNDDYLHYMGCIACGYMYYLKGEYEKALEYVAETVTLETYKSGINNSDALHGVILAALGRTAEAEPYYKMAIEKSAKDHSTLIESYMSYGQFLYSQGRYDEAIENYLKGLEITEKHSLYFYGHKIYDALSAAYAATGNDSLSVRFMKNYRQITDSVFNVEKERSFGALRRNYELTKHENEVLSIEYSAKKKILTIISVTVIVVAAALGIMLWQRKQKLMYKRLVKNYDQYIHTDEMRRKISAMEHENAASQPRPPVHDAPEIENADPEAVHAGDRHECISNVGEGAAAQDTEKGMPAMTGEARSEQENTDKTSQDPDKKLYAIFRLAEQKMGEGELFRDCNLSLENLADIVGTNRMYLSKAINIYAKTAFTNYVNSYRIRYAVKLLSDLTQDHPIKDVAFRAGYSNLQSFYKNFKKETGVPPLQYRIYLNELKNQQNDFKDSSN